MSLYRPGPVGATILAVLDVVPDGGGLTINALTQALGGPRSSAPR